MLHIFAAVFDHVMNGACELVELMNLVSFISDVWMWILWNKREEKGMGAWYAIVSVFPVHPTMYRGQLSPPSQWILFRLFLLFMLSPM